MSDTRHNTPARLLTMAAVHALDLTAQATAWGLGKFTRITGAGAFWYPLQPTFIDAWAEQCSQRGGSLTVRLGRLELVADWRG